LKFGILSWKKEHKMKRLLSIVVIGSLFLFYSFNAAFGQAPKPPKKTTELLSQGKKLYEQNCTTCHGPKGDGKGQLGGALKPTPTNFTFPLKEWPITKGEMSKIFDVITKGIPNTSMVKWDQLSEQERWALVYAIVEFASPKAPPKKK
jgi:mono/diheme cytochrome c family protein